jgi:hypothetical protein
LRRSCFSPIVALCPFDDRKLQPGPL